jgi:hypothetical protein
VWELLTFQETLCVSRTLMVSKCYDLPERSEEWK